MRKEMLVCPSTDPVEINKDFEKNIIKYALEVGKSGSDFLHCDVMDGEFVKKKTYDFKIVSVINSKTTLPLDVHLMEKDPEKNIADFLDAGANIVTVHIESFFKNKKIQVKKLKKIIDLIHKKNVLVGVSIKPQTEVSEIKNILKDIDLVLVMSVEPGKSGQKFLEKTYNKVSELNQIREKNDFNYLIEVDGGVDPEVSQKLKKIGCDMVVSGNYIFNAVNRKEAINSLK